MIDKAPLETAGLYFTMWPHTRTKLKQPDKVSLLYDGFTTKLRRMNTAQNKVSTLWMDGPLRRIDAICLASMVAQGLDVTVYTYGDIPNLPKGVKGADAEPILARRFIDRLSLIKKQDNNSWQPIANFSDFFRVQLMKHRKGLWLDSDVFVFRPFEYDTRDVFFAKEDAVRIGSPVYYLPHDHPVIAEFDQLMAQETLMPNWLGFKRGFLRPLVWKLRGIAYSPPDLGITIYGNDAFTRLAKRHGDYKKALPKHTFYHWTGKKTDQLFHDVDFSFLQNDPKHLGIHIHRKHWEHELTVKGSWWDWAQNKYTS